MRLGEKIESALEGKRFSDIDNIDLRKEINRLLIEAQQNIGLNITEGKTESMSQRIESYLHYYPFLTVGDLDNILHFGSIGFWGETFRLNMQVIHKWFSEYCKERSQVMQDLQKSDMCTTKERLQFLWDNRKKMPFWNSECNKKRIPGRTGLKRINEI